MRALVQGHRLMAAATACGIRLTAEMLADYDARDLLAPAQSLPAVAGFIAGVQFPVTAIVGANDTDQRLSNVHALAKTGAKVVMLPNSGHLCNMDSQEKFNVAVLANTGNSVA
jgi:pimeloyl-ACP methyl ester carboxylesterase